MSSQREVLAVVARNLDRKKDVTSSATNGHDRDSKGEENYLHDWSVIPAGIVVRHPRSSALTEENLYQADLGYPKNVDEVGHIVEHLSDDERDASIEP